MGAIALDKEARPRVHLPAPHACAHQRRVGGVHPDLCPTLALELRQAAGMVAVQVRDYDRAHVARRPSEAAERLGDTCTAPAKAGVDQHQTVLRLDQERVHTAQADLVHSGRHTFDAHVLPPQPRGFRVCQ